MISKGSEIRKKIKTCDDIERYREKKQEEKVSDFWKNCGFIRNHEETSRFDKIKF